MKRSKFMFVIVLTMVVFYLLPRGFFIEKGQTYKFGMDVRSLSPFQITIRGLNNSENKWIPLKSEYGKIGELQHIEADFGRTEIKKIGLNFQGVSKDLELKNIYIQVGKDKRYFTKRELRKLEKYGIDKSDITDDLTLNIEASNNKSWSLYTFKYLDYDLGTKSLKGQIFCFTLLLCIGIILFKNFNFRDMKEKLLKKDKNINKLFYFVEVLAVIALPIGILVKGNIIDITIDVLAILFVLKILAKKKAIFRIENFMSIIFIVILYIFGFKSDYGYTQGIKIVEILILYFLILNIDLDKVKLKCFSISLIYSVLYLIFSGMGELKYWPLLYSNRISGDSPVSVYALLLGGMILFLITEILKNRNKLSVLVSILLGMSAVVCMIASQSRGPILFIFVTLVLMLIFYSPKLGSIISLIGGFICILGLVFIENEYTERIRSIVDLKDHSTYSRIPIWKDSFEIIESYPLTGIGIGGFHNYRKERKAFLYKEELKDSQKVLAQEAEKLKKLNKEDNEYNEQLKKYQESRKKYRVSKSKVNDLIRYGSHNNILELIVSLGILGFLSYLGIFITILMKLLIGVIKNSNKEEKLFLLSATGIYLYIHLAGLTDNTIYMRGPLSFAYVMAAMALGYTLRRDRRNEA